MIPVYNVAPYLNESLDSIFRQNFGEYEVIVINDGSTDGSLKILNEYQERYTNMTVLSQANSGQSVGRNVGLEHTCGKYVYFFDSDDILTEEFSRITDPVLNNEADIIIFDADVFENSIGNGIQQSNDSYKEKVQYLMNEGIKNGLRSFSFSGVEYLQMIKKSRHYSTVVWKRIYKRSFLIENNIRFSPGIIPAEDDLHMFHTLLLNPEMVYFENIAVHHRIRKASTMSSLNKERSYRSFDVILKEFIVMKEVFGKSGIEAELIDWMINLFLRRIHTQRPSMKEARRLLELSKNNDIPVEIKTSVKMFTNLIRITHE